jgi:nitronate monooxygenase
VLAVVVPVLAELLRCPVVQAPMAGGVSTPALAAGVSEAGGLGFLAAGYKTPQQVRAEIAEVRAVTAEPFGVNVFVPDPRPVDEEAVRRYRTELLGEADRYGVELGVPLPGDDDYWVGKLEVLVEEAVPVASFTFGCPPAEVTGRLHAAGTLVIVTVTSVPEAVHAVAAGADVLCVQGIEAGGHRATFLGHPGDLGLLPLLALVRRAVAVPLVAAGGVMTCQGVAAAVAAGAAAAQLGTAFLAAPESGTHPAHRAALTDPRFGATALTRAFSGRLARGLTNRFMTEHQAAPQAYPAVHHLTKPIRQAAAAQDDPGGMALWAGQGHPLVRQLPAGELVGLLAAR